MDFRSMTESSSSSFVYMRKVNMFLWRSSLTLLPSMYIVGQFALESCAIRAREAGRRFPTLASKAAKGAFLDSSSRGGIRLYCASNLIVGFRPGIKAR